MKKGKPKISISLKEPQESAFAVSDSGTFREGDISIGKRGLLVGGLSPQANNEGKIIISSEVITNSKLGFTPTSTPLELSDLGFISGKEGVLGSGSSGLVKLAKHKPSSAILAIKIIQLDVEENVRKQIILELKTLHRTQCEFVVAFYDAFFNEGCIYVALEYMDAGSLSNVIENAGPFPENIIAKIAFQVLSGLNYLHKKLHLIHRDIKPCNLLINSKGEVKISDFGVSGQLAHTLSQKQSWVGTVTYMSPERITGASYSYDSDIWSLGLTLIECALGKFPYEGSNGASFGFWELMEYIVKQPAPVLPSNQFSKEMCLFTDRCLQKSPEERPSANTLLNDPWIKKYSGDQLELTQWLQMWKRKPKR